MNMIENTRDRQSDQERRLRTRSQDQRRVRLAAEGAGISPWKANVLVDVAQQVYLADSLDRPLAAGQMRYECVAADQGAGKTIDQCRMVCVVLTILDKRRSTTPMPARSSMPGGSKRSS